MAYKSAGGGAKKPRTSVKPKFTWQDMKNLPPATGGGGGTSMGKIPASFKAAHAAEWDAASHTERMAMRQRAWDRFGITPKPRPKKPRGPRKGGGSVKGPGGPIKPL